MEIAYLLAFPDANNAKSPMPEKFKGLKDAPYFEPVDIDLVTFLLLIGDWYTAKLYQAIQSELYLKDWKESVKAKLDNLENIVETIKDNFTVSFENLMDKLQLIGWVLLLIGYLYLYFLDAGWIEFP